MKHFIPSHAELLGYSGGMALYVPNWSAVTVLYELIETPDLLPVLNIDHYLN